MVCFDLGGVLVEINHRWCGALEDAGLPGSLGSRYDTDLTSCEAFNAYQRGAISLKSYLEELGDFLGGTSSEQALAAHNAILRSAYPGIPELIDDIRAAGIKTGCLSNTNAPHWEAMMHAPRLAVVSKLDFPIASHLIGAEKPDEQMYRAFEEASGAAGEKIVYFDDGAMNVDAANGLGWKAFLVDPQSDPAKRIRSALRSLNMI